MDRRNFVSHALRASLFGGAMIGSPILTGRTLGASGPSPPRIWSETEASLARIVLMLSSADGERVLPTVASLLAALRPATQVELLCADRQLLRLARDSRGTVDPTRSRPIHAWLAPEVESLWARDRFLAVDDPSGVRVLCATPTDQILDGDVPDRVTEIASPLSPAPPMTAAGPWEGGDLLAGRGGVLIGGTTLRRSRSRWGDAAPQRLRELAHEELGLRAMLVPGPARLPEAETWFDYHLDMLAALLADGGVLLGDPDAGDSLVPQPSKFPLLFEGETRGDLRPVPDRGEQRRRLRAIEQSLEDAGRTVHRVPMLVIPGRPWMLSYTNVLQEEVGGERIVYLPHYGVPLLDREASEVWRSRGYRVRPIDAASLIPLQGAIRCLTNVLQRA